MSDLVPTPQRLYQLYLAGFVSAREQRGAVDAAKMFSNECTPSASAIALGVHDGSIGSREPCTETKFADALSLLANGGSASDALINFAIEKCRARAKGEPPKERDAPAPGPLEMLVRDHAAGLGSWTSGFDIFQALKGRVADHQHTYLLALCDAYAKQHNDRLEREQK